MSPDELAKAADAAQSIAVRDYTFSGLLLLVLLGFGGGAFYLLRLITLRFFDQQGRRDAEQAKAIDAFRAWAEGHVEAISSGAGRISDAIESIESTATSMAHEYVTMRENSERDRRDSDRRRHDEMLMAVRDIGCQTGSKLSAK